MVRETVQRPHRDVLPTSLDMNNMSTVNPHRRSNLSLRLPRRHTRRPHPLTQLHKPLIHMLTINHTDM